jgi:DNA-binding NarL/FixJ family response regulator
VQTIAQACRHKFVRLLHIYEKLHVRSRTEAAAKFLRI